MTRVVTRVVTRAVTRVVTGRRCLAGGRSGATAGRPRSRGAGVWRARLQPCRAVPSSRSGVASAGRRRAVRSPWEPTASGRRAAAGHGEVTAPAHPGRLTPPNAPNGPRVSEPDLHERGVSTDRRTVSPSASRHDTAVRQVKVNSEHAELRPRPAQEERSLGCVARRGARSSGRVGAAGRAGLHALHQLACRCRR